MLERYYGKMMVRYTESHPNSSFPMLGHTSINFKISLTE